jgi:serine/threonine protein kinase
VLGETVGNFEITSMLGRGGWGAVYLAQQKNIKTRVAIKVLEHAASDPQHVQRFFNEATAVSQIPHSGIVKIFDSGWHQGKPYLVMEYLEGESLAARIRARKRLGIGTVADFGRQIASVLDATHGAGITHRDLKPDNIFLVRDAELVNGERVKILDFGIARVQLPGGGPRMTSLNVANIGTPSYMSPEQWHSLAEVDWRTDAYALGCVAFEMACGRPPFVGESMSDICAQHLGDPPPKPSSIAPGLPPELDRLILALLEKEPQARPSMRDAIRVFTELGHGEGLSLKSLAPNTRISPYAPTAPTPTIPHGIGDAGESGQARAMPAAAVKRSSRKLGIIAGVGLVAAAGITAVVLTSNGSSSDATKPAPPAPPPPADAAAVAVHVDAAVVAETAAGAPPADANVAPPVHTAPVAVPHPREVPFAELTVTQRFDVPVTKPTLFHVCFDDHGDVTDVEPQSEDHAVLKPLSMWRFKPYTFGGATVAACTRIDLAPKPEVANTPPRPPSPDDVLPEATIRNKLALARPAIQACGPKTGAVGSFNVIVTIDPDGKVAGVRVANPPQAQGFEFCIDVAVRALAFPKSKQGGGASMTFIFQAAQKPPGEKPGY